ncbi:MAG: transglycosylase SLT domain-containing protein [Chlorobiota bacterium]
MADRLQELPPATASATPAVTQGIKGTLEQLATVARGFEALLLVQLLRVFQQPLFTEEDSEEPTLGTGGGMEELALLPLAEFLATSGQGIGVARWLYHQWTGTGLPIRNRGLERSWEPLSTPAQDPSGSKVRGTVEDALRPYWESIREAAAQTGLSPELIAAVIWVESAANPRAVSPAGAQGLMQLMPGTARELGVSDPFEPRANIIGGSRYLQQMLQRFGSLPLALAAYNAGPGRVQQYGGIPPFPETQRYVQKVLALYRQLETVVTAEAPIQP